jgi:hypothetical protein
MSGSATPPPPTATRLTQRAAAPHTARTDAAEKDLRQAEHDASVPRIRARFDRLFLEPRARMIERGARIEPPGLGR